MTDIDMTIETTKPTKPTTEPEYQTLAVLMERFEIQHSTIYQRMNFLRIKPWKLGRRSQLDRQQVIYMVQLHEHILHTGKMRGFPVPEPTGPWESAIAVPNGQQMSSNFSPEEQRSHSSSEIEAIANPLWFVQAKAAEMLITENLLKQHYIQNPELLPEELQQKIKESAQIPIVDPFKYANALISLAYSHMGQLATD